MPIVSNLITGRRLACLLTLLVVAVTANAGQSAYAGPAEGPLRLPIPAGQAAAEVAGMESLGLDVLEFEAFGSQERSAARGDVISNSASVEWRDMKLDRTQRDWRFRGRLAQEDVILGTTDWRVGAWFSREF